MYGTSGGIDNGVMYVGDSIAGGGIIYAYNVTTGALIYQTTPQSMGYTGYWQYVHKSIGLLTTSGIYWFGEEHSPSAVLEPGFEIGEDNIATGANLWNITFWDGGGGFTGAMSNADGVMVLLNTYDQQLYGFAKGPTATTVQAPLSGIVNGQSFTIQGTVMDISPGTQEPCIAARFPHGVPAVAEADMTPWMEYVYMQNPEPTSVTGVPVAITVLDPNGNIENLGTVYSDSSGFFNLKVNAGALTAGPGQYTVYANFAGATSYYGSSAECAFTVNAAATPAPTPVTVTGVASTSTVEYGIVAVIIVIIIIGIILALLMLRKRP